MTLRSTQDSNQDGNRKGDVAGRDDDRKDGREGAFPGIESRTIESQRIEHAPEAVVEVHPEGEIGNDVDRAHPPHLKAGDEVVVDVALDEIGVELAERQVSDVVPDEKQD